MNDNIFLTVKSYIPLPEGYTPFDPELITHINSILGIVNQLGIGKNDYTIASDHPGSWEEFLEDEILIDMPTAPVISYVCERVKMLFDPPTSGILMEAKKETIKELEWRINEEKDICLRRSNS